MRRTHLKAVWATVMLLVTATACGTMTDHREEVTACAEGFLAVAKAGDMDRLTDYAAPEVLKALEWDAATIDSYTDNLLSAFAASADVDLDAVMAKEDIAAAVDELVDTINEARVQDYEVNADSYTEDDGIGTVGARVTVLTEESLEGGISLGELQSEVGQMVYDYVIEHPELLQNGELTSGYTDIITAILPDVLSLLKQEMAGLDGEEKQWTLLVEPVDDQWRITEIIQ